MCQTQESAPGFNANQSWNQFYPRCLLHLTYELMHKNRLNDFIRDGPLENLSAGGGGGGWLPKYKKNIRPRENSCTAINPKKYSCYGLKKNSYKEFDKEKRFL